MGIDGRHLQVSAAAAGGSWPYSELLGYVRAIVLTRPTPTAHALARCNTERKAAKRPPPHADCRRARPLRLALRQCREEAADRVIVYLRLHTINGHPKVFAQAALVGISRLQPEWKVEAE